MNTLEIERRLRSLSKYDLIMDSYCLGLGEPLDEPASIRISKSSYPGFEAHLFTIADASLWQTELTLTSDVILRNSSHPSIRVQSWYRLLGNLQRIMDALSLYRRGLRHGIIPSVQWISSEYQWYRQNWEASLHESYSTQDFLYSVDASIRSHIKELNELGFLTTQSCSGLPMDHPDREAYLPYVSFDERAYPRVSAHLFTLAEMTGWIPIYGPHNFDVELTLQTPEMAERMWERLVVGARYLAPLLADYRLRFKTNSYGYTEQTP